MIKNIIIIFAKIIVALLEILIIGCPFAVYASFWSVLTKDDVNTLTSLFCIFVMGALTFNAYRAARHLHSVLKEIKKYE